MSDYKEVICPVCNGSRFAIKYEAGYIYSYFIDHNAPGLKNEGEFLPFLFDDRQQKESKQYVECMDCRAQFPCFFSVDTKGINHEDLQKIINKNNLQRS